MSEHMSPIPSRIYNAAVGGHVAGADQIIDDETGLTLDKVAGGALEEKTYTSGSDNGMGRVVLRKNLVNGVNTIVQTMINKINTIYVIQYDFTLGEDITIPANCVLEFDGGSILGTNILSLSSTLLKGNVKISSELNGVLFDGQVLHSNWFPSLNKIFQLNVSNTVLYIDSDTTLDDVIELEDNTTNFVLDGNYHTITLGVNFIKSVYNASNITLKNIKLSFNNESPSKSAFSFCPINGYVQRNIIIENCYIYRCALGIYFSKDSGGHITNCVARNNKIIQEDTSSDVSHYGINNSGEYTIIEGNYIEHNNRHAIYQTSYGYGTKIRNNTLYNCHQTGYSDMGIIVIIRNSNNIIVEGNRFINCNGTFIACGWFPFDTPSRETAEGGDLNNIVIQNNIFYNPEENSTRLVSLGARTENGHYSKNIHFIKNIFCNISNVTRLIDFYDAKNLSIDNNYFSADFSKASENKAIITSLQVYENYVENITISNNTFKIRGNNLVTIQSFQNFEAYAWQQTVINIIGNNFLDILKSDGSLSYEPGSANMYTTVFNDSRNSIRKQIKKCGVTSERPILNDNIFNGVHFFDKTLNKDLTWDATNLLWRESDNAKAGVNRSGTFAQKPNATDIYVGFKYFCTNKQTVEGATDGIEIIHKGNNVWVDALGRVVS